MINFGSRYERFRVDLSCHQRNQEDYLRRDVVSKMLFIAIS